MAANLTTTYASQILDLLGLSKFKGGPPPPPIKISLSNSREAGTVTSRRPGRPRPRGGYIELSLPWPEMHAR